PNPWNYLTYVVQTTPGAVMNTDVPNAPGMNFSILGMPSTSYLYSIDGVDTDWRARPSTGPERDPGSDRRQHRLLRSVWERGRGEHQLHNQVREQPISRQRAILLERARVQC